MVVLIFLFQATEDADGIRLIRLIDHDGLEPALQGLVFLEVFLILVESRGTNRPQFATGECRLEDVGCIHGTFSAAGSYEGMNLIDEEDDVAVGIRHLFDDALQAFLELTFVFGSGDKGTHVERIELLVLQVLRHITAHDTLRQPLDDGGLTCTRLTYQNRIVLGTAREDLQHPADLLITSDDRVEFPFAGFVYEVSRIFGECLVVVVCTLALYFLSLPQFLDRFQHLLLRATSIFEDPADGRVDLKQS